MPATTSYRRAMLYCSFCRHSEHSVTRLISGPGVYICGSCVESCNRILDQYKESDAGEG